MTLCCCFVRGDGIVIFKRAINDNKKKLNVSFHLSSTSKIQVLTDCSIVKTITPQCCGQQVKNLFHAQLN